MIDAAKAEVAAMSGLKAGSGVVFIEDRVEAPEATYDGAAPGTKKTTNPDAPVNAFGDVGEMGQYTTFGVTPSAYTFNVDASGHVTTSGTGAVGFIVYDNSGGIIGFYNTASFKLPANAGSNYVIKAVAGNGSLTEATKDISIDVVVTEFPRYDKWYTFCSTLRNSLYIQSNGAGEGVVGSAAATPTNAMQWKFVQRSDDSGSYDIINRNDGSYLSPMVDFNTQIVTSAAQPAAGWKLKAADTEGMYIIYSTSSSDVGTELNQTNNSSYPIYNYGAWYGSLNTSDEGCQYTIEAVDDIETPAYAIKIASSAADNLATEQWYVMFDRGAGHGYLYENESNKLYNTNTEPGLVRADYARYLVRLSDAGSGKYYIETGYGNYLKAISNASTVETGSASAKESFTISKIASTDGHFYVQGSNSVVLDANNTSSGDATVVGYGTTVPTSIGGNNDWAFYPVELVDFRPTRSQIFTLNNTNSSRGALMSAPSQSEKWVWSSGENSQTFNASDANCQWIIVPAESEGQYYLYNVGKQKFVVPTVSGSYGGFSWMFSSDAVPVCLYLQSDGTFKMSTVSDNIYLSVSNSYAGPIINYNDAGAQFTLTKQDKASDEVSSQLSAALRARPSSSFTQSLNAVGSKSYATLYLDYDAQTDENTKAYYITETTGGYAQLTPVGNEGRNIPAYTAVVLVNENGDTDVTFSAGFSASRGYGEAVAESANLLKGTLTSMQLDLGDSTPYYSMGRLNGVIGFYKFSSNGTTSITLGAGKAYLEVPAGNSVKGYMLDLDEDATSINEELRIKNEESESAIYKQGPTIVNLSGQRLSKPQHGVNIVGGKKVFIK